ncbi:MAG: hypothetical protein ACRD2E_15555 [Terriglobales bacterium]
MDAVTYPQPEVSRFLQENFIPVKVNVISGDAKQVARLHHLFTPAFLVLEGEREHDRRYGFLPPEEMSAWMRIALGDRALNRGRYEEAAGWFNEAGRQYAQSAFTPRALYWEGVARYKQSGDHTALRQPWGDLAHGYPDSSWGRAVAWTVAPPA